MMTHRALAAAMALSLVAPTLVFADGAAGTAASTAQFDKGRALMKQKKYAEACEAFAQSQKLDPQNGTLFNLASCQMRIGKLASAWVAFRELAAKDTNATRKAESAKLAASLEPRLPHLTITLPGQLPGLAVTVDGADVAAVVGTPSPIDLGDHEVVATATGYEQTTKKVTVSEEGQTVEISLQMTKSPEAPPIVHAPVTGPAPHQPEIPEGPPPKSHRHLVGGIVTGAGVVAVGVGLVFGNLAKNKRDDAKMTCPDLKCQNADDFAKGKDEISSAKTNSYISTGAVIAGGALLGVGIYLLVTHSHAEHRDQTAWTLTPSAGPTGGGLSFGGSF